MLYEYESVFYPPGPDIKDGGIQFIKSTDELINEYKETIIHLEKHRLSEPSKKRKNKSRYRAWISLTHDYLDHIKELRDEIEKRKQSEK